MNSRWNVPAKDKTLDGINLVAGLLLVLSPWLLGFSASVAAAWNAWIVGALVALLAVGALVAFSEWEEWGNLFLGLWAALAPWVLGFADAAYAAIAHVVLGLLVAVLAAIRLWSNNDRQMTMA